MTEQLRCHGTTTGSDVLNVVFHRWSNEVNFHKTSINNDKLDKRRTHVLQMFSYVLVKGREDLCNFVFL